MSEFIEGVSIDWDTANRITVANLNSYKQDLETQVSEHLNEGAYMHPVDLAHNMQMITAINFVVRDFGVA